jgi:hypothetical protein
MSKDRPKLQQATLTDDRLSIMVHGDPRTGKTYFCASVCESPLKPIYLDCGNSLNSILREPRFQYYVENDAAFKVHTVHDLIEINNWYLDEGHKHFDTIIIDELDTLHENMLREVANELHDKSGVRNDWQSYQEDYGIVRKQLMEMFRYFLELDAHLIVTSWSVDKTTKVVPSLPGKLSNDIPGKFDILAYTKITKEVRKQKEEYWLHFKGFGRVVAGVRGETLAKRLGDKMPNDNFNKFYETWRNK